MKNYFVILLCLGLSCTIIQLQAGIPTLSTVLTLTLPGGETVNLYGDSDGYPVLYVKPSRLVLKKIGSRPAFDLVLFRGITHINPDLAVTNAQEGKLAGGFADCLLELKGATEDFTTLKRYLGIQYPKYAGYRLAMFPLTPGSASVAISHHSALEASSSVLAQLSNEHKETARLVNSGGPVSSDVGGCIPARFRLGELDAQVLFEKLNNAVGGWGFTGALDVQYSAEARINLPPTTINIKANKRRVYKYVESHFKTKGGFFFWSFSADIRKIRQKLEEDNLLEIEIDRQNDAFSYDFLQALADKWVEHFVLKEMHQMELDIPTARANAEGPGKMGFFKWANVGTTYAKVDIRQFIDQEVIFSWKIQSVETFPIYALGEFAELGPSNIQLIDKKDSYFAYTSFAVMPPPLEIISDPGFISAEVALILETKDGKQIRRSASFSLYQQQPYVTRFPIHMDYGRHPVSGVLRAKMISDLTYHWKFYTRQGDYEIKDKVFKHSNWAFDMPSIYAENYMGLLKISLLQAEKIFKDFPNLINVEIEIPGDPATRFTLSGANPEASLFFNKEKQEIIEYVNVHATYRGTDQYITKTLRRPVGKLSENLPIREQDIPATHSLGR